MSTIPTYRYQYRPSSSDPSSSSFSLSPPRNTLPHHHLESPTNIFNLSTQPPTGIFLQASDSSDKIIVRQVGGPGDNHVQWVPVSELIPYGGPYPDDEDEEPSSADFGESRVRPDNYKANSSGDNGANGGGGGQRQMKSPKSYISQVHGTVHTANWANEVGDRLWLRSDQPIIRGRKSVPVVNLDKGVRGEVCISSVTWHPTKRELSTNATITFIGAEYRHGHGQGPRRGGPFRMCIVQDPSSHEEGIIEMISLEELETCFEDVKPLPQQALIPAPIPAQEDIYHHGHGSSLPLDQGPAIFGELGERINRSMDDDNDNNDDNLSHASFASSTKGKVALDLVVQSLSIFNFNAAMLDLAALSNQSMGGFVRDIDEQPEASDDSDEDEDEEEEEKVWSDCESIQSSGRQSVMDDEDEIVFSPITCSVTEGMHVNGLI